MPAPNFGIIGSIFYLAAMIWLLCHYLSAPYRQARAARDARLLTLYERRAHPPRFGSEILRLREKERRQAEERDRRIILPGDPLWLASVSGRDPGDPPGGVPPPKPRTITIHISRS